MKHFLLFIALLLIPFGLFASNNDLSKSKHTVQDTIVFISPTPAQADVYPDTDISVIFNVDLDEKYIKDNVIKVKKLNTEKTKKHKKNIDIKGTIKYIADEKKLSFIPTSFLTQGLYEVDVKAIKSKKNNKHKKIKNIKYRFNVSDIIPTAIKITPSPLELELNSTIDINTVVIYNDDTNRTLQNKTTYITDNSMLNIQNNTLTALKEGVTTLHVTYKGLNTSTNVEVYQNINGHRLPQEPDPTVNNSTLLGIDSNDNGVRDDVERYIIRRFQNFQNAHIDRAIALQYAKATQIIIQEPERAYEKKTYEIMNDAQDCQWYYIRQSGKTFQEVITYQQQHKVFDDNMKDTIFNTKERLEAYMTYNDSLSGHVYDSRPTVKDKCNFDLEAVWRE